MPITEQDIKLLKSARMADTPDGGGRMTGNVVQPGVDNNIFDDVSNLDRVYGNVSLRKVFAAVQTLDTDKYLGARVIIDEPPADPNVHGLLFDASSTFDTRAGVSIKVESYLAQGAAYSGVLFGNHLAGQGMLLVARAVTRGTPGAGEVLVLQKDIDTPTPTTQFVRIVDSTAEVAEFEDSEGKAYKLLLCTCRLSDPLRSAFPGWGAVKSGIVTEDNRAGANAARTMLYQSVVADASQYYGIRPLASAASAGAYNIKADTIFSPLLPSAQVETPIADARTNGLAAALSASGAAITQTLSLAWSPTQSMFVGGGILPGSLTVVRGGITVTDSNGTLTAAGAECGSVDYANGVLSLSTALFAGAGAHTVTYTPAAPFTSVGKSVGIPVTLSNRSLSYVTTLSPVPARGSLSVSYLSNGRWYVLQDGGTGALTGGDASLGVGSINLTTGTLVLTLGALPDVGGAIVLQWAESAQTTPSSNTELRFGGKAWAVFNTDGAQGDLPGAPIAPGTLAIVWTDGAATRTVADDGLGNLTGDATGVVDYAQGLVYLSPNTLPPKDTVLTLDQTKFAASTPAVTIGPGTGTGMLSFSVVLPPGAASGSIRMSFSAMARVDNFESLPGWPTLAEGEVVDGGPIGNMPTFSVVDDGAGLLKWGARTVGTVDYLTGAVDIDVSEADLPSVQCSRSVYKKPSEGEMFGGGFIRRDVVAARPTGTWLLERSVKVSLVSGSGPDIKSLLLSTLFAQVGNMAPGYTLSGVMFDMAGRSYKALPTGTLLHSVNPTTGAGTPAGSVLGPIGLVQITGWQSGSGAITNWRAVQAPPADGADSLSRDTSIVFRTALANLRPGSLQVLGTMADGTPISVTAAANGTINGTRIKGRVNHEVGLVELVFTNPAATDLGTLDVSRMGISGVGMVNLDVVQPASLRYNAVAYSYLPLDASILGLDPVRLPSDGRVPVFKSGRVVLVHNTQKMAAQAVTAGQTINTGRVRLARLRVLGADGQPITTGWTADLDAGTVTFSADMPSATVEHRIEDEALCAEAQITGDLRLTRPLTHDYPAPGTYVSSAMIAGTKQAAAGEGFSQTAWTAEWSDTAIGNPITAQYNQTLHPIVVANQGAIEERWALIFNNSTTFRVVGKASGEILVSNTGEVCAPLNPATGVPYFSIAPGGWGVGWAAGNVLRFNTRAANWPIWVSRTVLQSPAAPAGTDQIVISVRGDVDA